MGHRNTTNKTPLVKRLMTHIVPTLSAFVCMSPSKNMRTMFETVVPPDAIYDDFKPDVIEDLFEKQVELIEQQAWYMVPHVGVFVDNCSADDMRSAMMRRMHFNARSSRCVWSTVLSTLRLPTQHSSKCGLYFCALGSLTSTFEKRSTSAFSVMTLRLFEAFDAVFREATKNHGALVLDRTSPTNVSNEYFVFNF